MNAVSAWSTSKRKSRRPWSMRAGVVTELSFPRTERESVSSWRSGRFVPAIASGFRRRISGSVRASGTSMPSWAIRPDFGRSCGKSAWYRLVHVASGTIAAHGNFPITVEFQTAPPPSEIPYAPIFFAFTSGRAARKSWSAHASPSSFGPSRPQSPPDSPWPRASNVSTT